MIRIDEIYNNTLWPWIQQHLPQTRLFFCDPPGRSDPESLQNFGCDSTELHYIFLHDQEPIHLDLHTALFDDVVIRNKDLNHSKGAIQQIIITSEKDSEYVDQVCQRYNWKSFYYFYHGWAALDWYRGYDKTFLIPPAGVRKIQHSFVSPNRIIGGKRSHRVLLMYYLLKQNINNALVSFPRVCPAEQTDVLDIVQEFDKEYPDIRATFELAGLPRNFKGESGHPMHSCWLSLFNECAKSLAFVITETVFYGKRNHLTEKTFKPICLKMPFVMVSTAGSLKYLRSYGFETFGSIWDESYDNELDDSQRLQKIANLLAYLDNLSSAELNYLYQQAYPIIEHNFNHFYNGGFEKILWGEFKGMLGDLYLQWRPHD